MKKKLYFTKGDLIMLNKTKNVEIIDFKKEARRRERKERFQRKMNDASRWVYDNKGWILLFGPGALKCTTAGIKAVNKQINLRKEKNLKDLYCYDRSLGHYWKLRRELKNSDWVEIDRRKQNGERLADILDELKLLK